MKPKVATSLLSSDIAAGERLLCSANLEAEDCLLFDYPSTAQAPRKVHTFINVVERVCDDVVRLEVELADGEHIDFSPGQYVNITVPGTESSRSYSMSSTPNELPTLEFYIRLLDNGAMSDYLRTQAKPDDVLTLEGPYGRFCADLNKATPMLFIAGGTGLSPVLSLIRQARNRVGRKPPMLLSFGCATQSRLFADETLTLLSSWTPSLDIRIHVEDGSSNEFASGNPVTGLTTNDVHPDTQAFICGPPGMVQAAHNHLLGIGVKEERIHYEQFTPSINTP